MTYTSTPTSVPPASAEKRRVEEILSRFDGFSIEGDQADAMDATRAGFRNVAGHVLATTVPSREQSNALTALEEAKYWTNQAIARYGLPLEPKEFRDSPADIFADDDDLDPSV